MAPALLALLVSVAVHEFVPRVVREGTPATAARPLNGAGDVAALCRRLVPAERLRPSGDAVAQGEARSRQETGRDEAITARYEITAPAAGISFAPYDGAEERMEVAPPATLRLDRGAAVLAATLERELPVRVDAATARRILAAQRAGKLALRLTFDLPDDAICGGDRRGRRHTLGVEPVEWRWLEGDAELAWGGVSADRPGVSSAGGARPMVEVGDPVSGPVEARRAVADHAAELSSCYADALKHDAGVDGVLVVAVGPKIAVEADSTGSVDLARCVERALGALGTVPRASVPIRFELATPPQAAGDGQ